MKRSGGVWKVSACGGACMLIALRRAEMGGVKVDDLSQLRTDVRRVVVTWIQGIVLPITMEPEINKHIDTMSEINA